MAYNNQDIRADWFPLTPSDTREQRCTGLYVGGAGHVTVKTANGQNVTFSNVAAGTFLPIETERVYASDTTATLILGGGVFADSSPDGAGSGAVASGTPIGMLFLLTKD
jgi:hypothetical protein